MATLFDRAFRYAECEEGGYGDDGRWIPGGASARDVRGTIQSAASRECLALSGGARNSGMVEVYSSERLSSVTRGDGKCGYVAFSGSVYRLESESAYGYLFGGHWRYSAAIVPESDVPESVREALS